MSDGKIFLDCPFSEKDKAKQAGARWDGSTKQWFVPSTRWDELEPFNKWIPNGRCYLNCPFAQKDLAKAKGARFDGDAKKWYYVPSPHKAAQQERDFAEWLPRKKNSNNKKKAKAAKMQAPATPDHESTKRKATATKSSSQNKLKKAKVTSSSTVKSAKKQAPATLDRGNTKRKATTPKDSSKLKEANVFSSSSPVGLRDLPRITSNLTVAYLSHELLHRNPLQKGISSKTKDWFLEQLGEGSVWESSPQAKEIIDGDNKESLPTISSNLTIAQLSHELLERNPTQKSSSGKNKQWYLDKLRLGTLWITGENFSHEVAVRERSIPC